MEVFLEAVAVCGLFLKRRSSETKLISILKLAECSAMGGELSHSMY